MSYRRVTLKGSSLKGSGSPDLQWATFGSIARKSRTAFRRASRWYMQRNAVSCVNQNLSLWIRLVGSGFVSSAQREHLYPESCFKKRPEYSFPSSTLTLTLTLSRAVQDGSESSTSAMKKKWRDTAARMRLESLSQTQITTYFSRTD